MTHVDEGVLAGTVRHGPRSPAPGANASAFYGVGNPGDAPAGGQTLHRHHRKAPGE